MVAAADKTSFVILSCARVGGCTQHWLSFWAKNFTYFCRYMMSSTSSIRLEHVYDTNMDLCLQRERNHLSKERDPLSVFCQRVGIQYCSISTRAEDLPMSRDPVEQVMVIIKAPSENIVPRSLRK
ncbi:hypothetical protein U1Q18_021962 [Sarracenia purpurea var. burkii]